MATDLQSPPEQSSMASLVNGIVHDFQDLIEQQVRLARKDLESGFTHIKEAGLMMGLGAGFLVPGAIGLFLMLVHLVHWLASPASADPASIPLWGCYALIGGLFVLVGLAFVWAAKKQVSTLPDQAVKALEENLEWKTNQTSPK
jgi:uncharacterized membrane protein YqjE